jgi:hypothetical protein
VQYYNVILKVIANIAAAKIILLSEERKQCHLGENGERIIGCFV